MVTDQLQVESTPPSISSNFEAIREQLAVELESADIVVTQETLADAKKKATEINRLGTEIDTRRKEAVRSMSYPIKEWEQQAKSLVAMCVEARAKITRQVDRFEAETLAIVRDLMQRALQEWLDEASVRDEFRVPLPERVEKLSYLLASGKLSAAGRKEVERIGADCLSWQQAVDIRLAALEGECMEAGLEVPLGEEQVRGILDLPDPEYQERLARLIEHHAEVQRKIRESAEAAAQQQIPAAESPPDPEPAHDRAETQPTASDSAPNPPAGSHLVAFDVRLEVNLPTGWTVDRLEQALRDKLASVGVSRSVKSITTTALHDSQIAGVARDLSHRDHFPRAAADRARRYSAAGRIRARVHAGKQFHAGDPVCHRLHRSRTSARVSRE